jgi:adenylyl-sulfate kinase
VTEKGEAINKIKSKSTQFHLSHLIQQAFTITQTDYEKRNVHRGLVIWLTGLSGSGKSTIANELNTRLFHQNKHSVILDGDNTRLGINHDLGFTDSDRTENNRRVAEIAKLFMESGNIAICSFISPFQKDRDLSKQIIGEKNYFEVFVDCSLEACENRDVKGMYKQARKGELVSFTGIYSPYEIPSNPQLIVQTEQLNLEQSVDLLLESIKKRIKLPE